MWAFERLVQTGIGRAGLITRSNYRSPPLRGNAQWRALCSVGFLTLMFALQGCSKPGLDGAYRTYIQRLGNTLDIAPQGVATPTSPRYPRSGKLQLPLEGSDLDTLEFLSLTGCAVQVTIGRRNSSLGRVAPPSQRLLLELEYLRLAPECVEHLRKQTKHKLAETLETAWQTKRQQLPALIFNATLGSTEFRALWRKDSTAGDYPPVQSSQVVAALGAINHHTRRWLGGDYAADDPAFELLLSDIAGGDAGIVLQALARQRDWLAQANDMLVQRSKQGPLCAPGVRHDAASVLPNVAQKYFVGEIQPHAAAMERRMYELLPPLQALETQLAGTLPENYRRWQLQRDKLLAESRAAPARHVAALQKSLANCGNLPQV